MQAVLNEDEEYADVKEPMRWSEELRREGRLQGQREGLIEDILLVWSHRFGATPIRVRERIQTLADPDRLRALFKDLLEARDQAAAEALLPPL